MDKTLYREVTRSLQTEFVRLHNWVHETNARVVVLFEGRDASGKGGAIKLFTECLDPRHCRVVVLAPPTERERRQWYLQRYVPHLPADGEVALFDRSWYNRAGLERVMGFCSEEQARAFLREVPRFEGMLVAAGFRLFKFYFDVSRAEQARRLEQRRSDPLRPWKYTALDAEAGSRFDDYSRAADEMLAATNTAEAPWVVLPADDKRAARVRAARHVLDALPPR